MASSDSHPDRKRPSILDLFQNATPQGGASSRLEKLQVCIAWRQRYAKADEYPMNLNGVHVDIKQIHNGELSGLGTGATVWPAAHVLAKYLEHRWPSSRGGMESLRVIELGAGTGAVGIAAALLGATVTLTDQSQIIPLMQSNIARLPEAVSDRITIHTYDWGESNSHLGALPFDVILISDCVLPKLYPIEPLIKAIDDLTQRNPNSIVLMSYEHRIYQHFDPRKRFEQLAREVGFAKYSIPHSQHDEVYQAEDIELWEYRVQGDGSSMSEGISFDLSQSDVVEVHLCTGSCEQTFAFKRHASGTIGSDVWASSLSLARYVWEHRKEFEGKKVIELGAGIGLLSAVLHSIGCTVVASDKTSEMALLSENVREFGILTRECDWNSPLSEELKQDGPFDLIVCADCLYASHSIEPLSTILNTFITHSPSTMVLFSNEQRTALEGFFSNVSPWLSIELQSLEEVELCAESRPVGIYRGQKRDLPK